MVRFAPQPDEITAIHYQRHWSLRIYGDRAWLLTPDGRVRGEFQGRQGVDRGRFRPEVFSQLAELVTGIQFFELDPKYINSMVLDGGSETVRVDVGATSRVVVSTNRAGPPGLVRLLELLSAIVDGIEWTSTTTPRKAFIRPTKRAEEMTDEEIYALADQMAAALGLTFPDDPLPEGSADDEIPPEGGDRPAGGPE